MRSRLFEPHLRAPTLALAIAVASLATPGLLACQGQIGQLGPAAPTGGPGPGRGGTGVATGSAGAGGGAAPDTSVVACAQMGGALNAGVTKVRRLTRDQFNNTVRDLLQATGRPADALAADERIGPFHSNAVAPITDLLVEQHQEVAATLATDAKARMAQLAPCDLTADTGTATTCSNRFITEFGRRAFRRPLSTSEVTTYAALYALGKQGGGAANGFRLVVETMLQSPFFLYHHDVGAGATPAAGTVPVTPYELASRLSYFLWNSMPDVPLFDLAANGTLAQESVLAAQVERMVKDDKAAATITLFHRQWLGLEDLPSRDKDKTVYPLYTPALADAMMQENALFVNHVLRSGDGLLSTLFTSNLAFPQGPLFQLYGVSQPAGYTAGTPVALDGARRAGILTQAAFLARHAHGNQTSPVHRGIVVRENILCQPLQSPPNNVAAVAPPPTAATSTRERFAAHAANPDCRSCHQFMDPLGLGFEHYDGIGAYRDVDGSGAVDARGEVIGAASPALNGPFDGAVELAGKLAASSDVQDCVSSQWFRFSLGRMESTDDACSMVGIRDAFRASGGNVRTLLARIAVSPAFRHVRALGN